MAALTAGRAANVPTYRPIFFSCPTTGWITLLGLESLVPQAAWQQASDFWA